MSFTRFVLVAFWCCWWSVPVAHAHGRLVEPPSRASAWRFGFATPHNYNDHELYCGGFSRQWQKNGGKCGVCGDAWDQKEPRPHELGGRFGQGVIVRRYGSGEVVTVKVELTANHNGFFEFRLCSDVENNTQECFDRHLLEKYARSNDSLTKYYPGAGNRMIAMQYKLPEGLKCARCVLQWRYVAGNNWGTCADGTGAVGCGPQEEFRACADVSVGDDSAQPWPSTPRPRPPYASPTRTTPSTSSESPTSEPLPESVGPAWLGLVIAVLTLFASLAAFALFYLYYYRGGRRIKDLLSKKQQQQPHHQVHPVRPPRARKLAPPPPPPPLPPPSSPTHRHDIEPGFEVIKLNDAKYST